MEHGAHAKRLEINKISIRNENQPSGVPLSSLVVTFRSIAEPGGYLSLEIDHPNYKYIRTDLFLGNVLGLKPHGSLVFACQE